VHVAGAASGVRRIASVIGRNPSGIQATSSSCVGDATNDTERTRSGRSAASPAARTPPRPPHDEPLPRTAAADAVERALHD
jgi:hypothetical protein